jgi:hypothetical protein
MTIQNTLKQEYLFVCNMPGDIQEHLGTLKQLADECRSVTEFGVRHGVSARAFLASQAQKFRFYDIAWDGNIQWLIDSCKQAGLDVEYIIANVLEINIAPVDLLFIDTSHTYAQLTGELERHHKQVAKYIVMHDTEHNGTVDEFGNSPALAGALLRFLGSHREWRVKAHYTNNNGLSVIERVAPSG